MIFTYIVIPNTILYFHRHSQEEEEKKWIKRIYFQFHNEHLYWPIFVDSISMRLCKTKRPSGKASCGTSRVRRFPVDLAGVHVARTETEGEIFSREEERSRSDNCTSRPLDDIFSIVEAWDLFSSHSHTDTVCALYNDSRFDLWSSFNTRLDVV